MAAGPRPGPPAGTARRPGERASCAGTVWPGRPARRPSPRPAPRPRTGEVVPRRHRRAARVGTVHRVGRVTSRTPVLRIRGPQHSTRPDTVAAEEPLEIRLAGRPLA